MSFTEYLKNKKVKANGEQENVDDILDVAFVPVKPGETSPERIKQVNKGLVPSVSLLVRWEDGVS